MREYYHHYNNHITFLCAHYIYIHHTPLHIMYRAAVLIHHHLKTTEKRRKVFRSVVYCSDVQSGARASPVITEI